MRFTKDRPGKKKKKKGMKKEIDKKMKGDDRYLPV
jgi:hypothetical protein